MSFCSGIRRRASRPGPEHPPAGPHAAGSRRPSPQASGPAAPPRAEAPFPPVDPANFTATSPTKQTVEDFLKADWGYDTSRVWQIQAILPTPAPGSAG